MEWHETDELSKCLRWVRRGLQLQKMQRMGMRKMLLKMHRLRVRKLRLRNDVAQKVRNHCNLFDL